MTAACYASAMLSENLLGRRVLLTETTMNTPGTIVAIFIAGETLKAVVATDGGDTDTGRLVEAVVGAGGLQYKRPGLHADRNVWIRLIDDDDDDDS